MRMMEGCSGSLIQAPPLILLHIIQISSIMSNLKVMTASLCKQLEASYIHVTGRGCMLIRWMDHVHKKSHLLNLHGACHIPNSGVCLISLGQLLNHGAKVQGDMHQINMLYGDGILLAPFTPGCLGSNMYTLESLPLKGLTMTCTLTYCMTLYIVALVTLLRT